MPGYPMPVNPGAQVSVPAPPKDRSFTLSQAEARSMSQGFRAPLQSQFHILRGTRGR